MTPGRAVVELTRERPVLAATWYAVAAAFVVRALLVDDPRVWAYLTFLTVLTGVLAVTDRAVRFSDRTLWLLLVAGSMHLVCGLLPGWGGHGVVYGSWLVPQVLRVDQAVHAFGSAAAAVAMWEVLGTYLRADVRATTQAVLAVLAALGKGALNEVLEFLMALTYADTFVGGYANTGWDLVFNLVGSSAAALLLVASGARRRPGPRLHEPDVPDVPDAPDAWDVPDAPVTVDPAPRAGGPVQVGVGSTGVADAVAGFDG